jgi:hypothetical protein
MKGENEGITREIHKWEIAWALVRCIHILKLLELEVHIINGSLVENK